MATDIIQRLLWACVEYRNIAIEKGATKEEFYVALGQYFDEEEFGDTVELTLKNLNYLYLNILSGVSDQPREEAPESMPREQRVRKEDEKEGDVENLIHDLLRTDLITVPTKLKRTIIDFCINEPLPYFPTDEIRSRIQNMDYQDFLKTPYWKSIALYVKEKAGKKCAMCGATKALEVHHLTYDNHGDELHHLDDLTCICRKCHENLHSK